MKILADLTCPPLAGVPVPCHEGPIGQGQWPVVSVQQQVQQQAAGEAATAGEAQPPQAAGQQAGGQAVQPQQGWGQEQGQGNN